tara:strand:- start:332 stop:562 length:231 start_codon:yes stop_codon:yes gene_type:complete
MIDLFEKKPREQERCENAFATLIYPGALKLGVIGGKAKKEPSKRVTDGAVASSRGPEEAQEYLSGEVAAWAVPAQA